MSSSAILNFLSLLFWMVTMVMVKNRRPGSLLDPERLVRGSEMSRGRVIDRSNKHGSENTAPFSSEVLRKLDARPSLITL